MKNFLLVLGGFVAGVVLTTAVAFGIYFYKTSNTQANPENTTETETQSEIEGVTMFEEPGEIFDEKSFEVFQVIAPDGALVRGKNKEYRGLNIYNGPVFLLVNSQEKYYYDDEIINVPTGKVVRQIGIYQYPTRDERYKTVPIVEILDE